MAAPRFDRSAIDILLNGHFWVQEVRPTSHDQNVRSDRTMLPITMVHKGTEEYKLFSSRRKLTVIATKLPYQRRLQAWVPGRLRWPIEDFLSRFLGEVEQSSWLLRVEFSWPHSHRWHNAVALHLVVLCLAVLIRPSLQTILAGGISGLLYGIVLRARVEKQFELYTYGIPLLSTCGLIILSSWSTEAPGAISRLSFKELLAAIWTPLGHLIGLIEALLIIIVTGVIPFVIDKKALRYDNDLIIIMLVLLVFTYASNIVVPLGAWYGALLKVVRDQIITTPSSLQQPQRVGGEAQLLHQQQQPLATGAAAAPTAIPARPAVTDYYGTPIRGREGGQQRPPGGPGGVIYHPDNRGGQQDLLRTAMKYAPEAGHPRRWLSPHASPYSQDYGPAELYRGGGGRGPVGRAAGWTAGSPTGAWRGGGEGNMDRYGLRSRRDSNGREGGIEPAGGGRGEAEEDDDGPPPPTNSMLSPSRGLYGEGRVPGRDGLGRYETMAPNRYRY